MGVSQSRDELLAHLKDHIGFMIASCKAYDGGSYNEAKRLAVSIRVLVHNTSSSHALLDQLGKKNMLFYDWSVDYGPTNMLPEWGLVKIHVDTHVKPTLVEYVPQFDFVEDPSKAKRKVRFDVWWGKNVFDDKNKTVLSRKRIVLCVANEDGGAHVDPKLSQDYANLIKFNMLGLQAIREGIPGDISVPIQFAAVRQIAYELLRSLQDEFPQLFDEPIPVIPMEIPKP